MNDGNEAGPSGDSRKRSVALRPGPSKAPDSAIDAGISAEESYHASQRQSKLEPEAAFSQTASDITDNKNGLKAETSSRAPLQPPTSVPTVETVSTREAAPAIVAVPKSIPFGGVPGAAPAAELHEGATIQQPPPNGPSGMSVGPQSEAGEQEPSTPEKGPTFLDSIQQAEELPARGPPSEGSGRGDSSGEAGPRRSHTETAFSGGRPSEDAAAGPARPGPVAGGHPGGLHRLGSPGLAHITPGSAAPLPPWPGILNGGDGTSASSDDGGGEWEASPDSQGVSGHLRRGLSHSGTMDSAQASILRQAAREQLGIAGGDPSNEGPPGEIPGQLGGPGLRSDWMKRVREEEVPLALRLDVLSGPAVSTSYTTDEGMTEVSTLL